jgi:hypothetical protein
MSEQIDLTTPSSIEYVDFALYDWLDKELNLFCNTKDGSKKVPVLWVSPERAFQIKNNKEFRDVNGAINPPMITVERTSMEKDQRNAATYYANLPPKNNKHLISKRINQKKTSEFGNADFKRKYGEVGFLSPKKNKKVVYQYKEMLLPVYININYVINIFTQFQQQMNELIQPFATRTGSTRYFLIERDGYKYECFIQPSIETKNNIASMEEEERRYISTITIKVLANVISDGVNEKDSIIKTFENAVEIKLPRDGITVSLKEFEDENTKNILLPGGLPQVLEFDASRLAVKKTYQILGNDTQSLYTVSHNLNSRDLYVSIREDYGDYNKVEAAVDFSDLNHIHIDMGDVIPSGTNYVVVIIG